jgi:gliding motility-associated-like protein
VSIYDRWGQLITDITGYSILKSWDGTNNGKPVTDGVYFYSIDFNDEKREILKGSVSVIR